MAIKRTRTRDNAEAAVRRRRILDAAFAAFMKNGYEKTSTREIATQARVSKRALYELFGGKQEMLAATISERAKRLQVPADLSVPRDRQTLARVLLSFGAQLLREITDPNVVGVFRLAIAEAASAPEIAWALESIGRETSRTAIREVMTRAHSTGLLGGRAAEMAEHFAGLLWGTLQVSLLLRVVDRPTDEEIARRAQAAVEAFLKIYPEPGDVTVAGSNDGAEDHYDTATL
jgi:AcrR family transcriptional regulator